MNIHTNFYKIPNKVYDLKLSRNELLVLNYLFSLINCSVVYPSKNTMAYKTNLSKRSVDRAIKLLAEKELITYKKGFGIGNKRKCNQYVVNIDKIDPECVIKSFKQINRENKNESVCMDIIRESILENNG